MSYRTDVQKMPLSVLNWNFLWFTRLTVLPVRVVAVCALEQVLIELYRLSEVCHALRGSLAVSSRGRSRCTLFNSRFLQKSMEFTSEEVR